MPNSNSSGSSSDESRLGYPVGPSESSNRTSVPSADGNRPQFKVSLPRRATGSTGVATARATPSNEATREHATRRTLQQNSRDVATPEDMVVDDHRVDVNRPVEPEGGLPLALTDPKATTPPPPSETERGHAFKLPYISPLKRPPSKLRQSTSKKTKVAVEDLYNGKFCLVTNLTNRNIDLAHILPQSEEEVNFELYDYVFGYKRKGLHMHTRGNLIYLEKSPHYHFDHNEWILLPSRQMIEEVHEFVNTVVATRQSGGEPVDASKKWPVSDEGEDTIPPYEYTLFPLRFAALQGPPAINRYKHPYPDSEPVRTPPFVAHEFPYHTLGPLRCHANPALVVARAGDMLENFLAEHPTHRIGQVAKAGASAANSSDSIGLILIELQDTYKTITSHAKAAKAWAHYKDSRDDGDRNIGGDEDGDGDEGGGPSGGNDRADSSRGGGGPGSSVGGSSSRVTRSSTKVQGDGTSGKVGKGVAQRTGPAISQKDVTSVQFSDLDDATDSASTCVGSWTPRSFPGQLSAAHADGIDGGGATIFFIAAIVLALLVSLSSPGRFSVVASYSATTMHIY